MMHADVTASEKISATVTDSQIPLTPMIAGSISTDEVSNTSVRRKLMRAEMTPLFKAVKKALPYIENPMKR